MQLLPMGLSGQSSNSLNNLALKIFQDYCLHFCCNFFYIFQVLKPHSFQFCGNSYRLSHGIYYLSFILSPLFGFLPLILKDPTQPNLPLFFGVGRGSQRTGELVRCYFLVSVLLSAYPVITSR